MPASAGRGRGEMASERDPRSEIPGTTTRFRFGQDNSYAYLAPLIAVVIVIVIGVYSFSYWSGNRDGKSAGSSSIEQPATKPDASPQAPNTSK